MRTHFERKIGEKFVANCTKKVYSILHPTVRIGELFEKRNEKSRKKRLELLELMSANDLVVLTKQHLDIWTKTLRQ